MKSFLGDGEKGAPWMAIFAFAVGISIVLVWYVAREPLLVASFAIALLVLSLGGFALIRSRTEETAPEFSSPDWSVTVAAIERPDLAIAITDRANRLVCANALFSKEFGIGVAPPALAVERASGEALVRLAREAWRDGAADAPISGEIAGEQARWQVAAERAGRGEDFLIWRFALQRSDDPGSDLAARLTGNFGALLSRAGVEAALVGAEGSVRAVTRGLAERSVGDADATLAGQEFVSLLRTDERDRIYFAREGRRGTPQTLVHVPLGEPDQASAPIPGTSLALMLLLDGGVGIGGGDNTGAAATPQLEALLAALPLGLAIADRDGRLVFANEPFTLASGLTGQGGEKRKLPSYPSDLVVREDKGALSDAVRRYGRGPASSGDMAVRLRHQPEEPVSLGLAGIRGMGEASVLLSLAENSEESQLKRQVAQATKMQAVGQLAGGVAHDFNNVLTAIIGHCDLMLLRHTPGDSDYDDIQQIRANSNRAASLTRQLLAFSRQQTLRPEVLQLPDVVSEVSQLLKRLVGEKITFSVRHDRNLGPVRADPQQLEQVIVNLAVNARDAINTRHEARSVSGDPATPGRLTMATRSVSAQDIEKQGSDIMPIADYTVLIVQDTGGGIPAEVLPKIFEPFFTTKDLGKGTGLGLSTVYGIVKQSGGFIFADNVAGPDGEPTGARFTVYLPVHRVEAGEAAASKPALSAPPPSDWSGGGHILLVEDEDTVRLVAERALVRAGYEVTTATDGEDGLAAIGRGDSFDLIVSDVVMPGMDGPAMARAIRKVRPDIPVLFMSGYAEEQLRKDIDIPSMHFIAKPFSVSQIAGKVGEVLVETAEGQISSEPAQ